MIKYVYYSGDSCENVILYDYQFHSQTELFILLIYLQKHIFPPSVSQFIHLTPHPNHQFRSTDQILHSSDWPFFALSNFKSCTIIILSIGHPSSFKIDHKLQIWHFFISIISLAPEKEKLPLSLIIYQKKWKNIFYNITPWIKLFPWNYLSILDSICVYICIYNINTHGKFYKLFIVYLDVFTKKFLK